MGAVIYTKLPALAGIGAMFAARVINAWSRRYFLPRRVEPSLTGWMEE